MTTRQRSGDESPNRFTGFRVVPALEQDDDGEEEEEERTAVSTHAEPDDACPMPQLAAMLPEWCAPHGTVPPPFPEALASTEEKLRINLPSCNKTDPQTAPAPPDPAVTDAATEIEASQDEWASANKQLASGPASTEEAQQTDERVENDRDHKGPGTRLEVPSELRQVAAQFKIKQFLSSRQQAEHR